MRSQVECPVLMERLREAGWNVERVVLPTLGWTAEWQLSRPHKD
jgi:hypothetical protein